MFLKEVRSSKNKAWVSESVFWSPRHDVGAFDSVAQGFEHDA